MSAQIIRLADYRRPKKTHAPKCRACRKPGHYYTTCDDAEALAKFNTARRQEWDARMEAMRVHFAGRADAGELTRAMHDLYPENMPGTPESEADHG